MATWDDVLGQAAPWLRAVFGLDVFGVSALGSNEDINVVASTAGGTRVLLKVSHAGVGHGALEAQNAVLRTLASDDAVPFEVPLPLDSLGGGAVEPWVDGLRLARVLTFVEGTMPPASAKPVAGMSGNVGRTAGQLAFALAGFEHPGLAEGGEWDLRSAMRVFEEASEFMRAPLHDDARTVEGEPDLVEVGAVQLDAVQLGATLAGAQARLARVSSSLRLQTIHGDLTADNVVFGDTGEVQGVIDFGDVGRGWLVAEIAVCACSLLQHDGDPVAEALLAIAAFDRECPLDDADIVALWPLIVSRAVVLVASAARVLAEDPTNGYALARASLERRMLERALALSFDEAEILVRVALGRLSTAPRSVTPMIRGLDEAVEVDLSVASGPHDAGAWVREFHAERSLLEAWATRGAVVSRYGELRLTAEALSTPLPRSLALRVEAVVAAGTPVFAPAGGVVVGAGLSVGERASEGAAGSTPSAGESLGVRLDGGATTWVTGVEPVVAPGDSVRAGDVIALAAALSAFAGDGLGESVADSHTDAGGRPPALVGIGWSLAGIPTPATVAPRAEALWRAACPDPSALVGRNSVFGEESSPRDLIARRHAAFAVVQEHYYAEPPQIERGWRHHLVDTTGRVYLDMINNVAILGHGEPRLTRAVTEQLARLNTNSRFHYESLVEYSEALAARAPEGLDVVLLCNSGSEAVDLAIRMARAATGRADILALTEAYHGWTVGADAISTSIGDNPGAFTSRPEWVHLLDAPNTYRGLHRGADAHRYLADARARLEELDARGVELAGIVSEPIFGNGGGIMLPDGYLAGLWAEVRARGGVCVSDEVQVSFGRLGEYFWGFEQQGVVPDIIAVAKGMGNGHPLGAVIATREIADAFAVEGSFFSSAGGSPVSCVVGSTVLRVLEDDGLQENARVVGAALADGLRALALRYPQLGAVHGMGLYLGVEVVSGGPDEPDPAAAAAICEDLLTEGIIVQPTGDHKNVLKIKPPLTIDAASVSRFLAALDGVLERRASRAAL